MQSAEKPFYWPYYSRELHEPAAEDVLILADTRVFLVKGNYILADAPHPADVAKALHYKVFLDAPEHCLRERLLNRHRASGSTRREAERRVVETDSPNMREIPRFASTADQVCGTSAEAYSWKIARLAEFLSCYGLTARSKILPRRSTANCTSVSRRPSSTALMPVQSKAS